MLVLFFNQCGKSEMNILKNMADKALKFAKWLFVQLAIINDTPRKIALGFALGVFLGILPAMGPVAALALSFLFKANRAAALLGSILTNTWLSLLMFVLSVKIGAVFTGTQWHTLHNEWLSLTNNFHWADLFKTSLLKIVLPIMAGYLLLALASALLAYLVAIIGVTILKRRHTSKTS